MPKLPIPIIIYRVRPEEAYQLGIFSALGEVLGQTGCQLGQLQDYVQDLPRENTSETTMLPFLKPIAALSDAEGIARSQEEACLWLLHPQLGELRPYKDRPQLLALQKSYGFYEAYLPHTSPAVPHQWYSREQLRELGAPQP